MGHMSLSPLPGVHATAPVPLLRTHIGVECSMFLPDYCFFSCIGCCCVVVGFVCVTIFCGVFDVQGSVEDAITILLEVEKKARLVSADFFWIMFSFFFHGWLPVRPPFLVKHVPSRTCSLFFRVVPCVLCSFPYAVCRVPCAVCFAVWFGSHRCCFCCSP